MCNAQTQRIENENKVNCKTGIRHTTKGGALWHCFLSFANSASSSIAQVLKYEIANRKQHSHHILQRYKLRPIASTTLNLYRYMVNLVKQIHLKYCIGTLCTKIKNERETRQKKQRVQMKKSCFELVLSVRCAKNVAFDMHGKATKFTLSKMPSYKTWRRHIPVFRSFVSWFPMKAMLSGKWEKMMEREREKQTNEQITLSWNQRLSNTYVSNRYGITFGREKKASLALNFLRSPLL